MRILHIITKARWGGAQRHVYDLAVAQKERGHHVAVWFGEEGPLEQRLHAAGIPTRRIPSLAREVRFSRDIASLIALTKALRHSRPDVVHLHSSKAGFTGALAARLARVPRIIFTAHNWAFAQPSGPLTRWTYWLLQGLTVHLTHRTIAVSHATAQALRFPGTHKRVHVVHNAVAPSFTASLLPRTQARRQLAQRAGITPIDEEVWWYSMSELLPVKGVDVAIEAFARVTNEAPSLRWRYFIAGEGVQRNTLAALVTQAGLSDRIHFLGHISEAATLLRGADAFLLPSRSEGLPYAALEAAAAGLPIVATRVGGVPEVLPHALLVPAEDARALAQALVRTMHEKDSSRASGATHPLPSFETMVDAIEALYR